MSKSVCNLASNHPLSSVNRALSGTRLANIPGFTIDETLAAIDKKYWTAYPDRCMLEYILRREHAILATDPVGQIPDEPRMR
jgi:hypothetical protein